MGWAVGIVIEGQMMFGAVVSPVEVAWGRVEPELALGGAATEPIETHIHGLGLFGDDGLIGDSNDGEIVSLDQGLGLGPTHFDEGLAQGDHLFGGNEEGGKFRFGGGGHDEFDYFGDGEDRTIEGRGGRVF